MADEEENKRLQEILNSWVPLAVDYGKYDPLMAGSIDGTDTRPHDRAIQRAMDSKCKTYLVLSGELCTCMCFR